MTKEELELEAEEWVKKDCCNDCCAQNCNVWCREVKHKYRAYLASAEPREKRIAELEKDKAYAEEQLDVQIKATLDLQKENAELEATIADLEATNKRISDECHKLVGSLEKIQKENAELKENYRKRGKVIISLEKQIRLYIHSDKLTKAKEIIKELLLLPYANNEEVYADVTSTLDKAEQFLKEINK